MPDKVDNVMRLCEEIVGKKLGNTKRSVLRGGAMAGLGAVAGGLLLGAVGFALGGALGGLLASVTSQPFESLPEILKGLTPAQRRELSEKVMAELGDLTWYDAAQLIHDVIANSSLEDVVFSLVQDYAKDILEQKRSVKKESVALKNQMRVKESVRLAY